MSDIVQRETTLAPAARLGGELRTRRQSLGWELPDLAQSLRIRQAYLEAIEAGRIGELPGTTYALGFVRAYATALGLQGEQMAGRFRTETSEVNIRPALSFPAPVPQRGVPAGALMLLGLVILAGAYAGWYYVSEHQRTPAQTVPPIPDRLRPTAETPAPSPQVASILPTASPPAPVASSGALHTSPGAVPPSGPAATQPSGPVATQPSGPASASPPAQTQAVQPPGQPAASVPLVKTAGSPPPAGAASGAPPAMPAGTRIVLKANADAWITVRQPGGPPLFNKLMHAGETWPVPADKPGLLLTTGNAGGTELDVDGTAIATLGGSGAVRRNLQLDPDALKAAPLPPIGHARRPPATADQG